MSDEIKFELLSLDDIFIIGEIRVYKYESDIILTAFEQGLDRLVHLYENEIDGRTMYGINKGPVIHVDRSPYFTGKASSIEISCSKGSTDWDFQSIVIKASDNTLLRISRNNASFPEPTFMIEP